MKNIILLFFVLAFTSCATFKANSLNENRQALSKNDLQKFEGTFKMTSENSLGTTLNDALFNYYSYQKQDISWQFPSDYERRVSLKVIDKNHLEVELCEGGIVLQSKTLKFGVKKNYLFFRKHLKIKSNFFATSTKITNTRISLLDNKNLLLDSVTCDASYMLLLFPFHSNKTENYGLEFERIE